MQSETPLSADASKSIEVLSGVRPMKEDLAWEKVESIVEVVRDDEEIFPTQEVWIVSFTDSKAIKPLHDHVRSRLVWEKLQHLKLIRRQISESGVTVFQFIVGLSILPPNDIPPGYSDPQKHTVPATSALSRLQLQAKNELWPTSFTPHCLPQEIKFTEEEVSRIQKGLRLAIEEAKRASALGELPIAACLLPDSFLNEPLLAHDTRTSTKHPLRHTVMNLVRALSDLILEGNSSQGFREALLSPQTSGDDPEQTSSKPQVSNPPSPDGCATPTLRNGEGYQLTNRSLFITHEPCLMCTMALVHSRVKEVFFLYSMNQTGGCGGQTLVPELPTINHRFNVWRWKAERIHEWGKDGEDIVIAKTLDV